MPSPCLLMYVGLLRLRRAIPWALGSSYAGGFERQAPRRQDRAPGSIRAGTPSQAGSP